MDLTLHGSSGDFLHPPTDLRLELLGLNHVLLTWTDNSDNEEGFTLERTDTGQYTVLDILPADAVRYTDSNLVYFGTSNPPELVGEQAENEYHPGTLEHSSSYYWRVDEVNANGTTAGQVWKFITEQSNSVEEISSEHNDLPFEVYPNPVSHGSLQLEYYLNEDAEMLIRLIDLQGRCVKTDHPGYRSMGTHRHVLELDDIPDGTYLLMLHNGKSYKAVRVMVARGLNH